MQVIGHPGDAGAFKEVFDMGVVIVSGPGELTAQLQPDSFTAAVLMTHHFGRDVSFLQALLPVGLPYLGLLGTCKRREQLLTALADNGIVPEPYMLAALRSPVGLDLGGVTPEEIALSIVAEVRAVLSGREGMPLRDRKTGIHSDVSSVVRDENPSAHVARRPATVPARR